MDDDNELYRNVPVQKIEEESAEYTRTNRCPVKLTIQSGYPYTSIPSPRDFERLLYFIYSVPSTKQNLGFYDGVTLMQGVGERGRDLSLSRDGVSTGLVQAKKFSSNISRNELGLEITKFAMYACLDPELVPDTIGTFEYHIVVALNLTETAVSLIDEINNAEFPIEDLEQWFNSCSGKKHGSLSGLDFLELKDDLLAIFKKLQITKVIGSDLDLYLAQPEYVAIVRAFFRVEPIIDQGAFDQLLTTRESKRIQFDAELSSLETSLRDDNEALFLQFEAVKAYAFRAYGEFGTECALRSNHIRKHQLNLIEILSKTVLGDQLISNLNVHEKFILCAAAFLTDIGVCDCESKISDRMSSILDIPEPSLGDIRRNHQKLSELVVKGLECVPDKYREAVGQVVGVGFENVVSVETQSTEFTIDPLDREKACMPLLTCSVLIADLLDVDALTAHALLDGYHHIDDASVSSAVWEATQTELQFVPTEDGKRVDMVGVVDDQLTSLGLHQHLKKVQKALSHTHELLRKLPQERQLTLVFAQDKTTSAFQEGFGFSVAEENILATFMDNSIYTDDFMSVRELIQNAIDSCTLRWRQEGNAGYTPEVCVQVNDHQILVSDNGVGMDRHEIQCYFSRLGRSFYKEHAVANSIGRFGVGVFAYFMVCDHFTVVTKSANSDPIAFTASPKAPYRFFFLDETVDNQGTSVRLALKPKFNNLAHEFQDYIADTFRHSSVPITVACEGSVLSCQSPGFVFSRRYVLDEFARGAFRLEMEETEFIDAYLDEVEFEGRCGIFLPSQLASNFDLRKKRNTCKVFQNGIFVCHAGNLSGEINLKKPLLLKANREGFANMEELQAIFTRFEVAILKQIQFDKPIERFDFTRFFTFNYYGNGKLPAELLEHTAPYHTTLVALGGNDELQAVSYHELKKFPRIGLLHCRTGEAGLQQIVTLATAERIPFVSVSSMMDTNFLRQHLSAMGYGFEIRNFSSGSYLLAGTDIANLSPEYTVKQAVMVCLLYTSPSPRDRTRSRMPSSA